MLSSINSQILNHSLDLKKKFFLPILYWFYLIYDFIVNLFTPILSVYILWLLGDFLSYFKYEIPNTDTKFDLFPLIGDNVESIKYLTCQANYVLPRELNLGLLASDLLDDYKLNDKIYNKIYKALMRISHELLKKYNPKFYKLDIKNDENENQPKNEDK